MRAITAVAATTLPQLSARAAKKFLANAYGKRRVLFEQTTPVAEFTAPTKLGNVQLYQFGEGNNHVLVTHGWADSTQGMETVINTLLSQGHCVWAFDHIGHGRSDGKTTHLFAFIDGLKSTLDFLASKEIQIDGIVAHSMGGVAVLNLDPSELANKKLVLMGLPVRLFESMGKLMNNFGISKRVLPLMLQAVSTEFQQDWNDLSPEKHRDKLMANVLLIHGERDRQAPVADLENFARGTAAKTFISPELGHRKLLIDLAVLDELSDFLHDK